MTEFIDLPRAPEIKTYPVKEIGHTLAEFISLYYKFGQVTQERFAGNEGKKEGIERSLWARMERAQLLKKLKRGEISLELVSLEKRKVDEIDLQFARQKDADIEVSGLGTQSAYYAEINLPNDLKTPEQLSKPPIFIIPPFAADLYGIEPLMKELALEGRRVLSIASPESRLGKTTEEYAKAVEDSPTYEPHISYFKNAIRKLIGESGAFDLWASSTGAPIAAEILSDPQFQQIIENTVFLTPVSVTNQSEAEFKLGVAKELARAIRGKHGWKTSDISVVWGLKEPEEVSNLARRNRIANTLMKKKIIKKMDIWKDVKVKGGKIILVSGEKDEIAKSHKALDYFLGLDQYRIIDFKKASHFSVLTQARYVVGKILDAQDMGTIPRYTEI